MILGMLEGLVKRFNEDPEGAVHIKEFDFNWESTTRGPGLFRTCYRIRLRGTRRTGPYENFAIEVGSDDAQEFIDRIEMMLEAAAK
jgi:hypothetical protein